jgi:uncharacterized membrane protein
MFSERILFRFIFETIDTILCVPESTTLKIISRKFLGVSLIWTFFSHVGAIFFETALMLFFKSYLKLKVQMIYFGLDLNVCGVLYKN